MLRCSLALGGALIASACFVDTPGQTGTTTAAPTSSTGSAGASTSPEASDTGTSTGSGSTSTSTSSDGTSTGTSTGTTAESTTTGGTGGTACSMQPWFRDTDDDGYGDPLSSIDACEAPAGYVDNDLDCDDESALINPDATELCDMIDNDCDGLVDEWSADNNQCHGCRMMAEGESVYHVCIDKKHTFEGGRARCQERGGDLVVIETVEENEILFGLVDDGVFASWLIGLSDIDTEGTFVWVDGSALEPGASSWSPNEPNDAMMAEDCVVLTSLGTWNDITCTSPRTIICEVPL